MTSLYKTIISCTNLGKPTSCLITNLSDVSQALELIQERMTVMKEIFVVINGDIIADNIFLKLDSVSNIVSFMIAGVVGANIDLSTGMTSIADVFDPAKARSSFVIVIFNKSTSYLAIVSEFIGIASTLRVNNKSIHCVFLQNGKE